MARQSRLLAPAPAVAWKSPGGCLPQQDAACRANEIRLIGGDKSMLGVMPLTRALDMADEEVGSPSSPGHHAALQLVLLQMLLVC